jgi:hypothetical protein
MVKIKVVRDHGGFISFLIQIQSDFLLLFADLGLSKERFFLWQSTHAYAFTNPSILIDRKLRFRGDVECDVMTVVV